MPGQYRKRKGRHTRRFKRYNTVAQTAKAALSTALTLKSMLNVEYQKLVSSSSINPSTTPIITSHLGQIVQGDANNARKGNSLKITSCYGKMSAQINTSGVATIFRIMLLVDNSANQGNPSATDILHSNNILSSLNYNNRKRFTVIYSKEFQLSQNGTRELFFSFYKKLNMKVTYDGVVGDVTDLTNNNLVWVFMSDEAILTPDLNFNIVYRYVDN